MVDILNGCNASETLTGANQTELISAKGGDDLVLGNGGDDSIKGSNGNDKLTGGLGDDTLIGGTGNDVMFGGDGADVFVFGADGAGFDKVGDFDAFEGDTVQLNDVVATAVYTVAQGIRVELSSGTDVLFRGADLGEILSAFEFDLLT